MTAFVKIAAAAGVIEFIIGSVTGFLFRRQAGVPIPMWVHAVAAASLVVGVGLVWQSQEVGGTSLSQDLLAPLLLPVFTYLSYGFYGARYLRKAPRASATHLSPNFALEAGDPPHQEKWDLWP